MVMYLIGLRTAISTLIYLLDSPIANHQIRTGILVRYAIANTPYNSIDYLAVFPRSGAMRSSNVGIPVEFICC
jgi:hypothetical protein